MRAAGLQTFEEASLSLLKRFMEGGAWFVVTVLTACVVTMHLLRGASTTILSILETSVFTIDALITSHYKASVTTGVVAKHPH
jgi:hypothetical protein